MLLLLTALLLFQFFLQFPGEFFIKSFLLFAALEFLGPFRVFFLLKLFLQLQGFGLLVILAKEMSSHSAEQEKREIGTVGRAQGTNLIHGAGCCLGTSFPKYSFVLLSIL